MTAPALGCRMAVVVHAGKLLGHVDLSQVPLSGDGVYELLRVKRGIPVFWARHWARLVAAAHELDLALPLEADVHAHVRALVGTSAELADAMVRLVVAHTGRMGRQQSTSWWATAEPVPPVPTSVRLVIDGTPLPRLGWTRHKTLSNLDRILALRRAHAADADDVVRMDVDGNIAETATAGLMLRRGSVWHLPISPDALASVTAQVLRELCEDIRIGPLPQEYLAEADAIVVLSAVRGPVAASHLDQRVLTVDVAWARQILDNYADIVADNWLSGPACLL